MSHPTLGGMSNHTNGSKCFKPDPSNQHVGPDIHLEPSRQLMNLCPPTPTSKLVESFRQSILQWLLQVFCLLGLFTEKPGLTGKLTPGFLLPGYVLARLELHFPHNVGVLFR